MQPLSRNTRRFYLLSFSMLFLVCFPIAILFASGYRFNTEQGFVRTGGVFVFVPYADAVVSMNGEEVGTSGLLKRGFYLNSLAPGSYVMSVVREGTLPWYRTLVVEPEIVTDAEAFLLPEDIEVTYLSLKTAVSTSTRTITRAEYDTYTKAFLVPAATSTAGKSGESLIVEKGNVFVRLVDEAALPASNFCIRPSSCVREIPIEKGKQTAINAVYFGGGIVYVTKEGGVFISEADVRPTAVSAPLYSRRGADIRVVGGQLIVKDGSDLYQIDGL